MTNQRKMEPQNTPVNKRPYRHIDLTADQIDRLPLYVKVAIAYADATINKQQQAMS